MGAYITDTDFNLITLISQVSASQCGVTADDPGVSKGSQMLCFEYWMETSAQQTLISDLALFTTFEEASYRRNAAIRTGGHFVDTDWAVKPSWAKEGDTIE